MIYETFSGVYLLFETSSFPVDASARLSSPVFTSEAQLCLTFDLFAFGEQNSVVNIVRDGQEVFSHVCDNSAGSSLLSPSFFVFSYCLSYDLMFGRHVCVHVLII